MVKGGRKNWLDISIRINLSMNLPSMINIVSILTLNFIQEDIHHILGKVFKDIQGIQVHLDLLVLKEIQVLKAILVLKEIPDV
jgi:hypothetical protein